MTSHVHWMDGVSAGSILAALTGVLPTVLTLLATTMAIIWYVMMISDWLQTRREKHTAHLAAQLVAQAALVAANVKAEADAVAVRVLAQADAAAQATREAAADAFMAELNCEVDPTMANIKEKTQ